MPTQRACVSSFRFVYQLESKGLSICMSYKLKVQNHFSQDTESDAAP